MDCRVEPGNDETMTPSRIHRLSLTHFRNYRAATVTARGDVVALVGPNGAGKTNCLEAISFLSPGRGLRRATLEDVADNIFHPDPYYQGGGDMVRIGGMGYAIDVAMPASVQASWLDGSGA